MNGITIGAGPSASQSEQEFQAKMKDRMRAAMGDLMPDDVLAGIVQRGINEAFFAPRQTPSPSGYGFTAKEPWTTEFLRDEMSRRVAAAVKEWIAADAERLAGLVRQTLEDGIAAACMRSFARLTSEPLAKLESDLWQLANKLARVGQ